MKMILKITQQILFLLLLVGKYLSVVCAFYYIIIYNIICYYIICYYIISFYHKCCILENDS